MANKPATAQRKNAARNRPATRRTAVSTKDVENDPRFSFGPVPIQTPEDALNAFLREEIDEGAFRAALARFGANPAIQFQTVRPRLDRMDEGFRVDIPDDLYYAGRSSKWNTEDRQAVVEAKQKVRDEATKKAENDKSLVETQKRETAEYRNELEKKHLVPALEKLTEDN